MLYTILTVLFGLFMIFVALLVFSMAQVSGRYDEMHARLYMQEIRKQRLMEKEMEEAYNNPEYIEKEKDFVYSELNESSQSVNNTNEETL